jgi:hypothetical protein
VTACDPARAVAQILRDNDTDPDLKIVATWGVEAGLSGPLPEPQPITDAGLDARITDAEVDGLYAPRNREEARQRRHQVQAAGLLVDYGDDDEFEALLERTVFNYPKGR